MDKVEVIKRIDHAVDLGDLSALAEIAQNLQGRSEQWAGVLRIRAIQCRMKLARSKSEGGTLPATWYERIGLPAPDGRDLYRYRLPRSRFADLEDEVKNAAQRTGFQRPHEPALFVLWAAEWFRLRFSGGIRRWQDIGDILGIQLEQSEWRQLTDDGLRQWKIKPLALNGMTHRLLTLARQGGFPIAAIKGHAVNWATKYLGQIVGSILAQEIADHDTAYSLAEVLADIVPPTWRSRQLFAVSGDLAFAIAAVRREAEAEGTKIGLLPSLWLNLYNPDWRASLPLETDGDSADALIDALMRAPVQKRSRDSVSALREIVRDGENWKSVLHFQLDGTVDAQSLVDAAQNWSRLRMYAAGPLTRFVPGELGILEPTDQDHWFAAAAKSLPREMSLPLDIPAEIEFRGDGVRIGAPMVLPGGEAQLGPMIICQQSKPEAERLTVIGSVGGRYRASTLFVIVPQAWTAQPAKAGDTVECMTGTFCRCPNEISLLYRVEGGAQFTEPDGERHRIRTGQSHDDRDSMRVMGTPLGNARELERDAPIFVGSPKFTLRENGQERVARHDELHWRSCYGGPWKRISAFDGIGPCEFVWRDEEGYVRSRVTAVVLPKDFAIEVTRHREDAEILLTGWPHQSVVEDGFCSGPGAWQISMRGRSSALLRLKIEGQLVLCLSIRLPRPTWLESWEGKPLDRRAKLALSDLHLYVARATGNSLLHAELCDASNKRVSQAELRIAFSGDLPLNAVRDDLAAMLQPFGQIDAFIKLYFSESSEANWTVAEFGSELRQTATGLFPYPAIVDDRAQFVGRAMHKPEEEVVLAPYGLAAVSVSPLLQPPSKPGVWLVYLRAGSQVLTRPRAMVGADLNQLPESRLGRISEMRDGQERHIALERLLQAAEGDENSSARIRREITRLACSLNGLPPATFDILSLLSYHPLLMARLMLEAHTGEISELAAVMDELPFSWSLVPKRCWDYAARLRFEFILSSLPESMRQRGTPLVFQAVVDQKNAIATAVPMLAVQLELARPKEDIKAAAQTFMQRNYDKAESPLPSPFRVSLGALLPKWPFDERFWRALDAPCAAAIAAAERTVLSAEQLRCIKDVERCYPHYFEQAYTAMALSLEHSA